MVGILCGTDRALGAKSLRSALALAEPAYRTAVWIRNKTFDLGLRQPVDLGRPTVSVGNLTTGGTGKTPVTGDFVQRLGNLGRTPAVLLRGYKATDGQSDEAAELKAMVGPQTPVEANPNRADGAGAVIERTPSVDCFVLDDGFQHRQARRNLEVVLIDATNPFGFEHLLPRGLLREPVTSLQRADAVIVTRADQVEAEALASVDTRVGQLTGRPPLAHAAHRWTGLREAGGKAEDWGDWAERCRPLKDLAQLSVVGVSGIGNPDPFARMLEQAAGRVLRHQILPDHYAYTAEEPIHITAQAQADGADAVVITEKDWVKWPALDAKAGLKLPVLRPVLELHWLDGGQAVDTLLERLEPHDDP